MYVFLNGKLILFSASEPFKGSDGEMVSYNIAIIQHDDGVATINTKQDFSKMLNTPALIKLKLTPDLKNPKAYKAQLSDIVPVESTAEKTIR